MNGHENQKETEEEKEKRMNQEATMEKLKTPNHNIKQLKTLEELLREKR